MAEPGLVKRGKEFGFTFQKQRLGSEDQAYGKVSNQKSPCFPLFSKGDKKLTCGLVPPFLKGGQEGFFLANFGSH